MSDPIQIAKSSFVRKSDAVMDFGKLPPQAIELEKAIIGAVLAEDKCISTIADIIHDQVFYVDAHQRIWRAIAELHRSRQPIDLLTVTEQLKKHGDIEIVGGPYYIAQLSNMVASSANVETHARIVFEKYIQRQVITESTQNITEAYSPECDPLELLDKAERNIRKLQSSILTGAIEDTASQVMEAYAQIEKSSTKDGDYVIRSKHRSINQNMNGWQRGTLNIIAARPGMGKSAFHVSEAIHLIKSGKKVLCINPEMTKRQFYSRVFCNLAQIQNRKLKEFTLSDTDFKSLHHEMQWIIDNQHLFTCDFTGGIKLSHLSNLCRKIKLEKGLDVLFLDYLQLVQLDAEFARGKNRDQVIGEITRELKSIAKNIDIAVVAFCQLSRATESKADKRPSMAELRESGNIEQDADTISFLLRPEYYFPKDAEGRTIFQTPDDEDKWKNICQFFCDKNREDVPFIDEFRVNLGQSNFYDQDQAPF